MESVLGYLSIAKEELGLKGEERLATVLTNLSQHVHPLVLGEIFRARTQIRFLAGKLITGQVSDPEKIKSIIEFLCADSGSHDYTLNRREAKELGLNIEKPDPILYSQLKGIQDSYGGQLALLQPHSPQILLGAADTTNYTLVRGLVETADGSYGFVSEGALTKVAIQMQTGIQNAINDQRTFEGWRKLA